MAFRIKRGLSRYELNNIARNTTSRYRKTYAELKSILLLVFNKENIEFLGTMNQGRNSNGNPRNPKYILSFEKLIDEESLKGCIKETINY